MFNKLSKINQQGFTLVEVMVAAFIVAMGVTSLMGLINRIYSYEGAGDTQLTAAYLGKEGIEIIRNIRDTNYLKMIQTGAGAWDNGLNICQICCEADYTTDAAHILSCTSPLRYLRSDGKFWSYSGSNKTLFQRKIVVTPSTGADGTAIMNVKVTVYWTESGRSHNLTVQEKLYNWWQI